MAPHSKKAAGCSGMKVRLAPCGSMLSGIGTDVAELCYNVKWLVVSGEWLVVSGEWLVVSGEW